MRTRCVSYWPSRIRLDLLGTVVVILIGLTQIGCPEEGPPCERCEFTFYWNSAGELAGSDETCREIDCASALCRVCYDITYNEANRPTHGTCDSCKTDPTCPERPAEPEWGETRPVQLHFCPMHPDECAAQGQPPELCGCVDLTRNPLHCGECYHACTDGTVCERIGNTDMGECNVPSGE